ncbi:MAG: choice-of-anchor B family protein [Bacteroidia bacterium]|nr:choice-of-anchor B family protein [Bacteroidia bacterium]
MKSFLVSLFLLLSIIIKSQTYNGLNVSLLSVINPNTSTLITPVGNKYSGCWAWHQANKNKEYAISGASNGTYFIDITNPTTPSVSAFVPGRAASSWREIKNYKNYCYIACDDAKPNVFQIVDMQYLPDSVHVINSSNTYFERGHTLWVDSNLLYVGGITFSASTSPMAIFSLATPSAPVLLKTLDTDIPSSVIGYVHDMYARHDTIYASSGDYGLHVLQYNATTNSLTVIGSYKNYPNAGYSHSSSLTQNGKYLLFCDEVPSSLPIHMVDVQNPANLQPLQSFYPQPQTTPHNPYIIGNNFAVVSCYQDGIYIFDISQPQNIKLAGYFDTYPQGGANTGTYTGSAYNGNWSGYPWLPSGVLIANDMQNGVFMLNASSAYTTTVKSPVNAVGLASQQTQLPQLFLFPNPANNFISLHFNSTETCVLEIKNLLGETVFNKKFQGPLSEYINLSGFANGVYVVTLTTSKGNVAKKLQVNH